MSPMLTSQGVVLATAMAVSAGTIILFDLLKDKYFPPHPHPHPHRQTPSLKSCLSSGKKKKKNRKRRVQFAEDVKETKGNGEVYRRQHCNSNCKINSDQIQTSSCANQILELKKMPANRVALYSGILRDRLHRMAYSY